MLSPHVIKSKNEAGATISTFISALPARSLIARSLSAAGNQDRSSSEAGAYHRDMILKRDMCDPRIIISTAGETLMGLRLKHYVRSQK